MKDMLASSIDPDTVRSWVLRAVESAYERTRELPDRGAFHKARSSNFVTDLAGEIGSSYADDRDVRTFTRSNADNQADFNLNELLYDVTVCRTATVMSATGCKRLRYVAAPLWHVESELKNDSYHSLVDFNKLVLGAAPLNLFVGPIVGDPTSFLEVLRRPASCCTGRVFAALIPHPRDWGRGETRVLCEELESRA